MQTCPSWPAKVPTTQPDIPSFVTVNCHLGALLCVLEDTVARTRWAIQIRKPLPEQTCHSRKSKTGQQRRPRPAQSRVELGGTRFILSSLPSPTPSASPHSLLPCSTCLQLSTKKSCSVLSSMGRCCADLISDRVEAVKQARWLGTTQSSSAGETSEP